MQSQHQVGTVDEMSIRASDEERERKRGMEGGGGEQNVPQWSKDLSRRKEHE